MPSSYSASARYTLQATGENNNTWGVILNNGVFQLVDDNVNGRLPFVLNGPKTLTTVLGGPDEARMAMLDILGGTGGTITIPPVPKGYFVRAAALGGNAVISAGSAIVATFGPGDAGPVFCDGVNVWPVAIAGLPLPAYIATQVTGGSDLPSPVGQLGKVMIVRNPGPGEVWIPDFLQVADVQGLKAYVEDIAIAAALLF